MREMCIQQRGKLGFFEIRGYFIVAVSPFNHLHYMYVVIVLLYVAVKG
jgi:hypothetical protein